MRVDADQLATHGLKLELDSDGARRRLELAPSRAVSGFYALEPKRHRIAAKASPALAVAAIEWELASLRVYAKGDVPAQLDELRVDLAIERDGGETSGTLAAGRVRLGSLELAFASLSAPVLLGGIELQALSLELGAGAPRIHAARATIARATATLGELTLALDDIALREVLVEGGEVSAAEISIGRVSVGHPDLRSAFSGRGDGKPEEAKEKRPLDLRFVDGIDGRLDVDLTADTTVPLIGRRKATHHFRIPIAGGTIDFKKMERNLSALEDSVIDFVVKEGALRVVKDIPLVPFDETTLVYWPLEPDELELAEQNRVRLRRLADYRIPPPTKPAKPGDKPSVAVRSLHFDNLSIDVSLAGPAHLELAGGRVVLGSNEHAAIGSLQVNGDVHHDADGPEGSTRLVVESADWQLRLENLAVGERRLSIRSLSLAKLERATVAFSGVRPGALELAAHGLRLRGARLGTA